MSRRPDWIIALDDEVKRTSQRRAARRIGYAGTTVSQVLSGSYGGNVAHVKAAVEGAFMGAKVTGPVLGEIRRDQCLKEQRRPLVPTNPERVKLYRACRSGCPHSHIGGGDAE